MNCIVLIFGLSVAKLACVVLRKVNICCFLCSVGLVGRQCGAFSCLQSRSVWVNWRSRRNSRRRRRWPHKLANISGAAHLGALWIRVPHNRRLKVSVYGPINLIAGAFLTNCFGRRLAKTPLYFSTTRSAQSPLPGAPNWRLRPHSNCLFSTGTPPNTILYSIQNDNHPFNGTSALHNKRKERRTESLNISYK